jgi:hypothetical protein
VLHVKAKEGVVYASANSEQHNKREKRRKKGKDREKKYLLLVLPCSVTPLCSGEESEREARRHSATPPTILRNWTPNTGGKPFVGTIKTLYGVAT